MRFRVGDRVVDTEADDAPELIVVDSDRGRADEVTIDETDETIAARNPNAEPSETVVRCVHVDWLERHVGDRWKGWRGPGFSEELEDFTREWRLSPRYYDFPSSRLALRDGATSSGEGEQSSMDEWLG